MAVDDAEHPENLVRHVFIASREGHATKLSFHSRYALEPLSVQRIREK
jgi:hypothetical protein